MLTPLISIIIPTYNSAATMLIAMDSIVNQTFKNWEVLIIDGDSTDATLDIATNYQEKFPHQIHIHSEKDKGIYDAMNKGIDLVNGEWLYFMGSDDSLYETTTLEKISKLAETKSFDVIYGNVTSPRFNGVYDGEFSYFKLEFQNICHQAIFLNRSVFKKIGKFNLKYSLLADWEHNIRWFFNKKIKNCYVNLIFANYGEEGLSSVNEDDSFNKDKLSILLFNGFKVFNYSKLISICTDIILINKNDNKKIYILFYSFVRFTLRQLRKIKKSI